MGKFESGLGQRYLSLPNDEGQDLVITQVSVGLRAELKQLPYNHSQRPGKRKMRENDFLLRFRYPPNLKKVIEGQRGKIQIQIKGQIQEFFKSFFFNIVRQGVFQQLHQ